VDEVLAAELAAYGQHAFDQMGAVARRVGEDGLNVKPLGDGTNAVGSLVVHCVGVCEFWLGHVGLGRATARDRDAEFEARPDLAEVERVLAGAGAQMADDLRRLAAGEGQPSEWRDVLIADGSDRSLGLHVLEELYQHLGHMELAADILAAARR
jgi:hypothetical protein